MVSSAKNAMRLPAIVMLGHRKQKHPQTGVKPVLRG